MKNEKTILTGIKPTGAAHIGNYAGMILPLINLQKTASKNDEIFVMIADLHALTTSEDYKNMEKTTLAIASLMIASGINPEKMTIFVQSHLPEHSELGIILSTVTPMPLLELNPVYKEAREEHPKLNTIGLLNYPVLQAADILLYKATHVPVGKDQLPHIEITREIARKFNAKFGKTFSEPKEIIREESKIISLSDSSKKMSKSHGKDSYLGLLDSANEIREKIKIAVTDSGKEIKYDPEKKPAISNLLSIFSLASGEPAKKIEARYAGKGYVDFKKDLAETVINFLKPIREKCEKTNEKTILKILKQGSKKAQKIASRTLKEAKEKIGFLKNA